MIASREEKLDQALEDSFPASDPLPIGSRDDVPPEKKGNKGKANSKTGKNTNSQKENKSA